MESSIPFSPPLVNVLTIHGVGHEMLVTLRPDGTLEYGPNYHPDEAARLFWEAIAYAYPKKGL